jgi:RHH-type proline utilization regulon transcriptional repressor/proline dehydrogenase/delta 1-pyrroline-5-carboxylate dehydrogenase
VGNPKQLATDIGPVIDQTAFNMLTRYCEEKKAEWPIIAECKSTRKENTSFNFLPIAFEVPRISDLGEEKFGPILHVLRYKSEELDLVIEQINNLGYGLTMGVHTRIDSRANRIAACANVGNLYINRNQIGAVVGVQPFGGEGLSGTGPKAGGPLYLKRLSRPKNANQNKYFEANSPVLLLTQTNPIGKGDMNRLIHNCKAAQKMWTDMDINLCLSQQSGLFRKYFNKSESSANEVYSARPIPHHIALPGPTGEKNQLTLLPRGVIAVIGGSNTALLVRQLYRVLSTGNGAIIIADLESRNVMSSLSDSLQLAGMPQGLISFIGPNSGYALLSSDIDGVICDGPDTESVANYLCRREGPILPCLSVNDEKERFFKERTRTDDTTAAGGNASLLAL